MSTPVTSRFGLLALGLLLAGGALAQDRGPSARLAFGYAQAKLDIDAPRILATGTQRTALDDKYSGAEFAVGWWLNAYLGAEFAYGRPGGFQAAYNEFCSLCRTRDLGQGVVRPDRDYVLEGRAKLDLSTARLGLTAQFPLADGPMYLSARAGVARSEYRIELGDAFIRGNGIRPTDLGERRQIEDADVGAYAAIGFGYRFARQWAVVLEAEGTRAVDDGIPRAMLALEWRY